MSSERKSWDYNDKLALIKKCFFLYIFQSLPVEAINVSEKTTLVQTHNGKKKRKKTYR